MENTPIQKSKKAKTLLKCGLTVVFVVILPLAIILATIDLDEAKNTLIQKVSTETGMKVEIKSIPFLGNILTGGKKGGLIETYFKINGEMSEPKVTPQPHKSLIEKPGAILKKIIQIHKNLSR